MIITEDKREHEHGANFTPAPYKFENSRFAVKATNYPTSGAEREYSRMSTFVDGVSENKEKLFYHKLFFLIC